MQERQKNRALREYEKELAALTPKEREERRERMLSHLQMTTEHEPECDDEDEVLRRIDEALDP